MMRDARSRTTPNATVLVIASALMNDGAGREAMGEDFGGVFISRRKGGTTMERPTIPRMQPSEGMFFGKGAS